MGIFHRIKKRGRIEVLLPLFLQNKKDLLDFSNRDGLFDKDDGGEDCGPGGGGVGFLFSDL